VKIDCSAERGGGSLQRRPGGQHVIEQQDA
jgi:hypothetical protein